MTQAPGSVEEVAVSEQNTMLASLDELFAGAESNLTLRSGKKVEVPAAKVKQLKQITAFITDFVSSFEEKALVQLIMKVSARQEAAIEQGTSPYLLHTNEIVKELAGEAGILMSVLNGGLGQIGKVVSIFSNITEEEFDDLELDEAGVLLFAIFGRNYSFFTHQVLPVIRVCIQRVMVKHLPPSSEQSKKPLGQDKSRKA